MKVLALYDIHGNVEALEAVLADAPSPDVILVGGDAVPGAFAADTRPAGRRTLGPRQRRARGRSGGRGARRRRPTIRRE